MSKYIKKIDNNNSYDGFKAPRIAGASGIYVYNSCSDNSGGFYIVGSFASVTDETGTVTRNRAFHCDSQGSITDWNPNLNSICNAIYYDGTHVYLGGSFTQVNGSVSCKRLIRVDPTTGIVDETWLPDIGNNYVSSINIYDNIVYAGGGFTLCGVTARNRFASFDINDGSLTTFNPNLGNNVYDILISENYIYVCGIFSTVNNNSTYKYLVRFNLSDKTLDSTWISGVNNVVNNLKVYNNYLYAFGSFTGTYRYIIRFSYSDGTFDDSFTPYSNNSDPELVSSWTGYVLNNYLYYTGNSSPNGTHFHRLDLATQVIDQNFTKYMCSGQVSIYLLLDGKFLFINNGSIPCNPTKALENGNFIAVMSS